MSDSDRKVFPIETVLALVTGKDGVDLKEIAGYVTGRSILCDTQAQAVGVFAAAWLTRWYPKFMDLIWSEDQNWDNFVSRGRGLLGDHVSLTPMDGTTMALTAKALDYLADAEKSVAEQTAQAVKLEERVRELEPVAEQAKTLQKKADDLEEKLKAMKTEMGGLNLKISEFDGKVAIDHDELMRTIKDAIKDGMKGMVVAGAATGAVASTDGASADATPAEEAGGEDDFGFGASGSDSDGFGF